MFNSFPSDGLLAHTYCVSLYYHLPQKVQVTSTFSVVHVFQIQISHLTALDPPYPPSLKSTTTSADGLRALNRAKDNSVFHRQNPCLYNSRCLPCFNITMKHKANKDQILRMFSILCSPLLQFIILPNNRLSFVITKLNPVFQSICAILQDYSLF